MHREPATPGKMSILVADDHKMVATGLQQLINDTPDLRAAAVTHDGLSTIEALARQATDVLLLDFSMPEPSGLSLIQRLRDQHPALPILVMSFHNSATLAQAVLGAGALGYVVKSSAPDVLLQALRQVAHGVRFIDPTLVNDLLFSFAPHQRHPRLTAREQEVLQLLAAGHSNREIAHNLQLSEKTVSTYRVRLSQKLGVHTRHELMAQAQHLWPMSVAPTSEVTTAVRPARAARPHRAARGDRVPTAPDVLHSDNRILLAK